MALPLLAVTVPGRGLLILPPEARPLLEAAAAAGSTLEQFIDEFAVKVSLDSEASVKVKAEEPGEGRSSPGCGRRAELDSLAIP